jgi:hypothetical protein
VCRLARFSRIAMFALSLLLCAATVAVAYSDGGWEFSLHPPGVHRFFGPHAGLELSCSLWGDGTTNWLWKLPTWKLGALALSWPAWCIVRRAQMHLKHFRSRRLASGRCPHCNYDLRATPDRCPECGAVVAPSSGSGSGTGL